MEERHIQERFQLNKQQIKEVFFLQRHQVGASPSPSPLAAGPVTAALLTLREGGGTPGVDRAQATHTSCSTVREWYNALGAVTPRVDRSPEAPCARA